MSSNPQGDRPRLLSRIRSPRSWSLRARLLVTQVALLAVVCALIGVATEFALQRFLIHQLDQQVIEAGRRSAMIFGLCPPPPPGFVDALRAGPAPAARFRAAEGDAGSAVRAATARPSAADHHPRGRRPRP